MKLDLSEIALNIGKRIRYEINEPPLELVEDGLSNVAPVIGEVTFTNTGKLIVTRGHFSTRVEVECARCLVPYGIDLELPIEEELPIPLVEMDEEQEEEEVPEEEQDPLFVDNILDLSELLRQDILVAVPIKPLCSEECKGLCPQCGKNLNEGPCECAVEVDTPFAALESLLEEGEKEE